MTASSRGSRTALTILRSQRNTRPSSCLNHTSTSRTYAIAATSLNTTTPEPNSTLPHLSAIPPVSQPSSSTNYITKAGILLSRPPLLTPTPSPFEEAYFFYQKRLHERLALPFSRYFYFKSGTPADADYKLKAKQRGGAAARELGGYTGYGEEAWNDELLVGDKISGKAHEREVLVKDAKRTDGEDDGKETEVKVLGRRTESDKSKDERRLDRMLGRTLYLVVRGEGERGRWRFPVGGLEGRENLGQAAERILIQTAGLNMNTWIVGHAPIGHQTLSPTPSGPGSKVFFMKGRIMAGQANLEGNVFGWSDFKWLTREEVQRHVGNRYWSDVRNMLADR